MGAAKERLRGVNLLKMVDITRISYSCQQKVRGCFNVDIESMLGSMKHVEMTFQAVREHVIIISRDLCKHVALVIRVMSIRHKVAQGRS